MNIIVDNMIEVLLESSDDFLKIRETLTRIGVASKKDKKIFQSCHILHKQNRYFIVHFKELFALDGKNTDFSEEDKGRRNTIVSLLKDWGLLRLSDVQEKKVTEPRAPMSLIKILPYKEKAEWTLEPKYNIGSKRGPETA